MDVRFRSITRGRILRRTWIAVTATITMQAALASNSTPYRVLKIEPGSPSTK